MGGVNFNSIPIRTGNVQIGKSSQANLGGLFADCSGDELTEEDVKKVDKYFKGRCPVATSQKGNCPPAADPTLEQAKRTAEGELQKCRTELASMPPETKSLGYSFLKYVEADSRFERIPDQEVRAGDKGVYVGLAGNFIQYKGQAIRVTPQVPFGEKNTIKVEAYAVTDKGKIYFKFEPLRERKPRLWSLLIERDEPKTVDGNTKDAWKPVGYIHEVEVKEAKGGGGGRPPSGSGDVGEADTDI